MAEQQRPGYRQAALADRRHLIGEHLLAPKELAQLAATRPSRAHRR